MSRSPHNLVDSQSCLEKEAHLPPPDRNHLRVGPARGHMTPQMLRRKGTWGEEAGQRRALRVTPGAVDTQPTQAATVPVPCAEVKAGPGETHKPGRPRHTHPQGRLSALHAFRVLGRVLPGSAQLCRVEGRTGLTPRKEAHKCTYHNGLKSAQMHLSPQPSGAPGGLSH